MPGTSAIGGLVSGLDTASLIEQLVGVSRRRVDLVVNNRTAQEDKLTAFQSLNTQLSSFQTKAEALKDSDTFDVFKTSTSTTSTTYTADELVTVTATEDASPGTHTVSFSSVDGVAQLAQARQLSSESFTSSTEALGLTGEFIINGTTISIATTDSLADIISTINTANSGTDAIGVTATLISVSDTDNRMILTSDNTGADQFVILDASISTGGDANILETLGYTDGTTSIKNPTSDGAKSEAFTSSTSAVGSLLGQSNAQNSSTVQIGGVNVTIDLAANSLTNIADTISAVDGVTASVVSTTTDGATTYQLDISGTTVFVDSNNILEALGVLEGGQGDVAEIHIADAQNYDTGDVLVTDATTYGNIYTGLVSSAGYEETTAGTDTFITSATTFDDIDTGGDANTISDLDTISISGTKQDGTAVAAYNFEITVASTTTIQDLLTNIEDNFGLSEGSVIIDATGAIQINDDYSGHSALDVAFVESAGTLDFGTFGDESNVISGDTITLSGTKHDGTVVSETEFIINTAKAFDDAVADDGLLLKIETLFGLTAGSAEIDSSGQIKITDSSAGDSQLSVVIRTNNENGGTLDFGTVSVTQEGYAMEATAGLDANVVIDGVAVTRSSNSIDDVISGVTLDISRIEAGETVNITISRDTDSIKGKVSEFTTAYNEIIENINQQFAFNEDSGQAGVLSGESTLRTIKSILQSTISNLIPDLPSGSNALSLIGITSDKYGKLSIKDSIFLSEINSDFYAVKRMFVAEGTTTNNEITYLTHTKNTDAGDDYAVTITTVATQASRTGDVDLNSGIGVGKTETLTITDTSTGRVATIELDGDAESGNSIDNIVNTINSELATESTQILVGDVEYLDGSAITASTVFLDIDGVTNLEDDDRIVITGTNRSGASISETYTISDVDVDTVQGFLTAIENAFDNDVSATIDTSGRLVVTDHTVGDSQLSITRVSSPDSSLDFGNVLATNTVQGGVTGRYAMEITASKDGSDQLVLTHDSYGSGYGFTVDEPADPDDYLGIEGADGTSAGVDVAGSLRVGETATGTGQILRGDTSPDSSSPFATEDLAVRVTSTSIGPKDNVKLTMGVGELMYRNVDTITDQFDGLLTIRMDGLQDTIDDMQESIVAMEGRLAMETLRLNKTFVALELNLSKLQSVSSFMSQQLSMLAK